MQPDSGVPRSSSSAGVNWTTYWDNYKKQMHPKEMVWFKVCCAHLCTTCTGASTQHCRPGSPGPLPDKSIAMSPASVLTAPPSLDWPLPLTTDPFISISPPFCFRKEHAQDYPRIQRCGRYGRAWSVWRADDAHAPQHVTPHHPCLKRRYARRSCRHGCEHARMVPQTPSTRRKLGACTYREAGRRAEAPKRCSRQAGGRRPGWSSSNCR